MSAAGRDPGRESGHEPGHEPGQDPGRGSGAGSMGTGRRWLAGLLPLVLLAGILAFFRWQDPMGYLEGTFPPVEELTIDRVTFPAEDMIRVHVVNGGPEAVTVAQVMVDEAYWRHGMDGPRRIPRLGERTIDIPYHWVQGEPHEITLVTSTGLTFTHEVPVSTLTPTPDARFLGTFALLGLYAGVVPVLIGLLWYPFLRDLEARWLDFFLSLTMGLLLFLGVDGLQEALEVSGRVPEAYQGVGLVALGILASVLGLRAVANWRRGGGGGERRTTGGEGAGSGAGGPPDAGEAYRGRLRLAYMIALGIGLHNLGEGLAIGAAYTAGELALGSFLVIGFALHNTTEGLGIVAPVAEQRPSLWHLAAMGGLAGLPTIAGTWIGGFSYSPIATTLFLALGVGAIFEVTYEIGRLLTGREGRLLTPMNAAGLAAGLVVMYGTAVFVVA